MNGNFDRLQGAVQDGQETSRCPSFTSPTFPNYWRYAQTFTLDVETSSRRSMVPAPQPSGYGGGANNTDDNLSSNTYHSARVAMPGRTKGRCGELNRPTYYTKPCFASTRCPMNCKRASPEVTRRGSFQSVHLVGARSSIRHIHLTHRCGDQRTGRYEPIREGREDGTLPQVSWLVMNEGVSEHPPHGSCARESLDR